MGIAARGRVNVHYIFHSRNCRLIVYFSVSTLVSRRIVSIVSSVGFHRTVNTLVTMNRYMVLASLVVGAVIAFECQKRQAPTMTEFGWDVCDANGLSCCYYINATSGQSIVLYSHGYT